MQLPKFGTTDQPLNLLQTRWAQALNPIISLVEAVLSSNSYQNYNTSQGYGANFTYVRRIENLVTSRGSAITVTLNANNGTSVAINSQGLYSVVYTDQFSGAADMAITKNYATGTTPNSIPIANLLAVTRTVAANAAATISWVGQLVAGDTIRFAGDTTTSGNKTDLAQFSVTYLGLNY